MTNQKEVKKHSRFRLSIVLIIISGFLFFTAGFYYFYFYEPVRPFNIDSPLDRELWNHNCPFNYSSQWSQASGEIEIQFRTILSNNLMRRGDNQKELEEKYKAVLIAAENAYDQQLIQLPPKCLEQLHIYMLAFYSTYADACKAALNGDYEIGQNFEFLISEIQENIEQEHQILQGYFEIVGY